MSLSSDETYCTLAEADQYWDEHPGGDGWASADEAEKQAALRQATQYVDNRYRWIGRHSGDTDQPLSWPRIDAVDKEGRLIEGIPEQVVQATAYMAGQVVSGGILQPAQRGGAIQSLTAGSVQVHYAQNASSETRYSYVDLILKNITRGGRGSIPLRKA